MKRLRKILGITLLAAAQIVAACYIVDFVFKKYEKDHVYTYVSKDAPEYSLGKMLLNDHNDVVAKKKPAKEFRVLVFGDSFTYAVTQAQYGFCAVLERRLNEMFPDRRVRVVNLGFPSISFPEYLERFYFWSQALEYDAVIFNVYLGNDFNDVRKTPFDPGAFAGNLAELCTRGMVYGVYSLVPHQYYFRFMDFIKAQVLFKLQSDKSLRRMLHLPDLEQMGVLPDTADPRYRSLLPLTPAQMDSEMRSSLKPFVRETMFAYENDLPWYQLLLATAANLAAKGKPVLVMLSPPLCAVSPDVGAKAARDLGVPPAAVDAALPERVTRELARRVGLPQEDVLDLTPCLAARTPTGEDAYTGVDTHWSPAGNAWVGDLLAERLAARWFGHGGAKAACAPSAIPAFEPIPAGLAVAVEPQAALAASIVDGCPTR
jgi:hypothetical protein